jgi:glutamate-1-semialdehyde 2,1-aminomutase
MKKRNQRSEELFDRAKKVIPGGVNSPVRAFKSVGGVPPFIAKGSGSKVYDVDENEYIDYVLSWGPLILGHAHPDVIRAAREATECGSSFGAPTKREVEFASEILKFFPAMDMIRLVSSGTEASMTAIRLARGYTKREKIVKFEGCYHGHTDSLLSMAGSGVATLGIPSTPGVTTGTAKDTITIPYNDLNSLKNVFEGAPDEIAAVIVEPVAGNMGVVLPVEGFLEGIIDICRSHSSLTIFDEVMCGFRVDLGGAQTLFGLSPDITLLGKVIGGGFPLGAIAGRREIMERLAPSGDIYQAGTLSGNPVAVAAGLATIKTLSKKGLFQKIVDTASSLKNEILESAKEAGINMWGAQAGTMASFFFCEGPVFNFDDAKAADGDTFKRYFHEMLNRGIYLAPSPFEALFLSSAHTEGNIKKTISALREVLRLL